MKLLGEAVFSIFTFISITFVGLRFLPGGPFDRETPVPLELRQTLVANIGLDRPLLDQFLTFWFSFLRGDLGTSWRFGGNQSVVDLLFENMGFSFALGGVGFVGALLAGTIVGIWMSYRLSFSVKDRPAYFVSLIVDAVSSIPNFVWCTVVAFVFRAGLYESIGSLLLPAFCILMRPACLVVKTMTTRGVEVFSSDYVLQARARGVREWKLATKHALKNMLSPLLGILPSLGASVLTGSFVVETVFSVPGAARFLVNSIVERDFPCVVGFTLVFGIVLILLSFAAEGARRWLDPRLEESAR